VNKFVLNPAGDERVDIGQVLRWLYTRILELGYKDKLFAKHDVLERRYFDRMDHLHERIGKKYQWIAFNELLARFSDNCFLQPEWGSSEAAPCRGPWQIWMRDIDPSCWLEGEAEAHACQYSWWVPFTEPLPKRNWEEYVEWVCRKDDLPFYSERLKQSLWVSDPKGRRWILVYANFSWQSEREPGEEVRSGSPWREIWFHVRGYLVKEPEATLKWSRRQDFWNYWMPEWDGLKVYQAFLGEYPWHPSWKEAHDRTGWQKPNRRSRCRHQFLVPYVTYAWSSDYDYSSESRARLVLPAPWLVEEGSLRFDRDSLAWRDETGRIVAWDPAGVSSDQPHALLLDADWLAGFLNGKAMGFFWAVAGEKRCAIAGSIGPRASNRLSGGFVWTGSEIKGGLRSVEYKAFPEGGSADEGSDSSSPD